MHLIHVDADSGGSLPKQAERFNALGLFYTQTERLAPTGA